MTETTVFLSGNSQAVRLLKEFRFKSKTVEILRRGNEVVLREKPRTMGDVLAEAFAGLPPDTRSWDTLWDGHAAPPEPELEAVPAKATKTVGRKVRSKTA